MDLQHAFLITTTVSPPAAQLFGTGLLSLTGVARRKMTHNNNRNSRDQAL